MGNNQINYNICDNRKNIIDERMLSTELFSFANLQKAISELINYEEDKISKIIKQDIILLCLSSNFKAKEVW